MTVQVQYKDRTAFRMLDSERMTKCNKIDPTLPEVERQKLVSQYWRECYTPGMLYEAPWYYDPGSSAKAERRRSAIRSIEAGTFDDKIAFLSRHYWMQWSHIRPPLIVICPNGEIWCPDQVSSNGTGWEVTDCDLHDYDRITCSPSIVVPGYHGFLRNGVFTADMDSPHPNGTRGGVPQ